MGKRLLQSRYLHTRANTYRDGRWTVQREPDSSAKELAITSFDVQREVVLSPLAVSFPSIVTIHARNSSSTSNVGGTSSSTTAAQQQHGILCWASLSTIADLLV
jgi:hypothetical protein